MGSTGPWQEWRNKTIAPYELNDGSVRGPTPPSERLKWEERWWATIGGRIARPLVPVCVAGTSIVRSGTSLVHSVTSLVCSVRSLVRSVTPIVPTACVALTPSPAIPTPRRPFGQDAHFRRHRVGILAP